MRTPHWSILGTVGVPGAYGGFETLAENLVRYHQVHALEVRLSVYCSARTVGTRSDRYLRADLRYIGLKANGPQSVAYDMVSLLDAIRNRTDVILLLGVSGALALPLVRAFSRARIVTNIDGIEWQRAKWRGLARLILRWSERAAVRWSHAVIADNAGIAEHVRARYGTDCHVIAYGGDHALEAAPVAKPGLALPQRYALALCRIEPENNVEMILDAFARHPTGDLVVVGNWDQSAHGRTLRARYGALPHVHLVDPVYEPEHLRWIRDRAEVYIHGHSAGGTNPALVEMMHFGIPVLAFDCAFNRNTTDGKALYFSSADALADTMAALKPPDAAKIGRQMRGIAAQRYTWAQVGRAYVELMRDLSA
jgi:glycosyltransferase involved in cell wall biosynthesis